MFCILKKGFVFKIIVVLYNLFLFMCIMNRYVVLWEGGGRNKNMEMKSEIVINILC